MSEWDGISFYSKLEDVFLKGLWEEVYFIMQLLVKYYPMESINESFIEVCNEVLEEENSAYRFIAGRILPTMSELEITEVEKAVSNSDSVSDLMDKAVEKLSQGDTRNAIKEAVSAVELMSNQLSSMPGSTDLKKTLPRVLGRIEEELGQQYNPNLKGTFLRLYDYASSERGIRHGDKKDPTYAEEAEARFVLVICSAFINYLRTKADEAGIEMEQSETDGIKDEV